MTLRKILPLLVLIVAALCLDSCKSTRQIVETEQNTPAAWTRVRVPVNLKVSSPANLSVSATVTMIRDTSITVSAKVFGMEVFVAHATDDSVLVVDKMHRQYIGQNISRFLADMPLNASSVQDILTGHPVDIPQRVLPVGASVSREMNGDMLAKISFDNRDVTKVSLTYPSVVSTPFGDMAESTVIDIQSEKTKKDINAVIEWQWSKARWNDGVEPREIKLSGKYTPIDPSDITGILGGAR
ncbi:MAG: DUF4292 domain-containing protein [Paramuribaculum sp.]|nr:DUF4292 domain-containing protein [Paramuribaculum sp.]